MRRMEGMQAVILLTYGYSEAETWTAYYRFLEEGAKVIVAGPLQGIIQGQGQRGRDGKKIEVTHAVEDLPECDCLFIPGGHWNPMELRVHEPSLQYIKDSYKRGALICGIEHASWVLISAEIVKGKKICCTPDVRDDVNNAGGICQNQIPAILDNNILTCVDYEHMNHFMPLLMKYCENKIERK